MSANELALKDAMRQPIPVARFRGPDGSSHTVAVTEVEGGWRILDQQARQADNGRRIRAQEFGRW